MELKKQIEALLFSCGRKINICELAVLTGEAEKEKIAALLNELKDDYVKKGSPLIVVDEGEYWKLTTHEKYLPLVQKINPHTELSKTIMETLAVIAWKQPMLQSDVIKIRTNKAYDHVTELENMGFVVKEKHGRSYLLKLTQKFFEYFDLNEKQDIKKLLSKVKGSGEDVLGKKEKERIGIKEISDEDLETTQQGIGLLFDKK